MLAGAENALIIVGYTGRNHATVPELVKLVDAISGTQVLDCLGSDVCFPWSCRAFLGVGIGRHESIENADAILVVDCDVPWIPTQCKPLINMDAKIIHIDVDPLKQNMPLHHIPTFRRYRAEDVSRWDFLAESHLQRIEKLMQLAEAPADRTKPPSTSHLCSQRRKTCPSDTIWHIEAVTNAPFIYEQLRMDEPAHLINGGGGLGWSGGATIGVKLASDWLAGGQGKGKFVTPIVGDGTYMFGVPVTVYWIARRYGLPTLTVALSNKRSCALQLCHRSLGWNAPRNSLTLVHPYRYGSKISNEELNISFSSTPDFSGIGKAAAGGNAWAGVVSIEDLSRLLPEAIEQVQSGIFEMLEVRLIKGSW